MEPKKTMKNYIMEGELLWQRKLVTDMVDVGEDVAVDALGAKDQTELAVWEKRRVLV